MGYWDKFEKSKSAAVSSSEAGSKFDFFDKTVDSRELIHPKLSRMDKADLWKFVETQINKDAGGDENQLDEKKIPKFMVYDIYNKYFVGKQDMVIGKSNEANNWLYEFIVNKLNNYYTKPITENQLVNSAIFTTEVVRQLIALNKEENPNQESGDGEGESQIEKALQGASNSKINQMMNQANNKASEKIEQIEQMKDEVDTGDGEDSSQQGSGAGKGDSKLNFQDIHKLEEFYELLQNVNFNNTTMANFFRDTLKMSSAYFSGKYKEEEESLLDADDVSMLEGLENLLPQLKNLHLDDVVTYKRKYQLKFDVYVDTSGSMGSISSKNSNAMLAKVIGLKLHKLGLVDDFYCFDTRVTSKMKGLKFLKSNSGGGTSLNNVVEQIIKLDRPSLVITDASDRLSYYSEKAYFVGVPGAHFSSFRGYNNNDKDPHESDDYFSNGQLSIMRNDGTLEKVTSY